MVLVEGLPITEFTQKGGEVVKEDSDVYVAYNVAHAAMLVSTE